MLIYHAGTGRAVFIGCMKVTTVFIFTFFTLIVAPIHFYSDEQPNWVAPAVTLSGLLPLVFVAYTTKPFVTYVHLLLPQFARQSRELLFRYAKALPKDAVLEITTMNSFGKPVVSRVKIGELFPSKARFGLANYSRDTTKINKSRPWWMGKAVGEFGIHGGKGKIKEGGVWEIVRSHIEKRR
ncbi:hypothetical protein BP6252_03651 [Coleophoma cylindrospora]|uniref:Uncharacterized protein n=1 Tax=Coleophoma cylindrospora TaxID=1849047 RepID=A0A3D8S891_9HELO|nr:hypothetical protein BP6252_03651 [Coleophoma cylindrospora]